MTLLDLLVIVFCAAGFALLIQASALGDIPYKPFSCGTCLSGWGGFVVALLLWGWPDNAADATDVVLAMLLATGGAHLLLRKPTSSIEQITPPALPFDEP